MDFARSSAEIRNISLALTALFGLTLIMTACSGSDVCEVALEMRGFGHNFEFLK